LTQTTRYRPRKRQRSLIRVEPGQRPGLLGVRKQDAGHRRRLQEAIDAECRDEARRPRVDGEPVRARALERRPRGGLRPRLKK